MNSHSYVLNPQKLKINSHDPRCHQKFLLLSNDMKHWKAHVSDNNWWQEREKQCFGLFHQYGYDLQTGAWYCLVACQRNSWQGLSSASLMLANGFAKQQKPCWPPLAAQDLRRQILDWYCIHLLPVIYALPLTTGTEQSLGQLLSAAELLQEHASALQSTQRHALQQLSHWLVSNINVVGRLMPPPVAVSTISYVPQFPAGPIELPKSYWREKCFWGITGAVIALSFSAIILNLKSPTVLAYSNQVWPGNGLFTHWRQQLEEKSAAQPEDKSYSQLNNQLDLLEQRLIDAEQRRKSHVTISELKTVIYQMRQILRQQEMTLENQLNTLQSMRNERQRISPELISSLSLKLDALNSRYLLLTTTDSPSE